MDLRVCVVLLALMGSAAFAAQGPVPADRLGSFLVPRIQKPPTLDGVVDPEEWKGALAIGGLAQQNPGGNLLILRPTTYFLAWDEQNLYLACRTWIMPGLKPGAPGRTPNSATAFDPGMEFNLKPMGRNAAKATGDQSFKFFINTMAATGDMCRVAVGMLIRNWQPSFQRAFRLTEPASAPLGGRWWECEVVLPVKEFGFTGPNVAGDTWRMLLAFNHLPGWMQAAVPIRSGYFDSSGHPLFTLVDDAPAVQVTMDDLPGVKDGVASAKFRVFNPTDRPVEVSATARFTEFQGEQEADLLKKEQVLKVEPGKTAEMTVNEKFPHDLGKKIGGLLFHVAQGDRTLYRYFSYFQLGYGKNWVEHTPAKEAYPLSCRFNPVRNRIEIQADTYYLADPSQARSLKYRVAPKTGGQALAEGQIEKAAYHYFTRLLDVPALQPGEYTVETTMALQDGKQLGPVSSILVKKDEAKEFAAWWQNKLGDVERLIPPFTAMKRDRTAVSLWGRTYRLTAVGLPAEVVSRGRPVLAAPARIVVAAGGKEERVPLEAEPAFTEEKEWRYSFRGEAKGAGLIFRATGTVEQDGLVQVELTYAPAGQEAVKVDALRLEWPLSEAEADCIVCIGSGGNFASHTARLVQKQGAGRLWSTLETGITGSLMAVGSFYPDVWVGNEQRGFLWCSDTDRGWVPDNDVPAHELVRAGGELVLRNNIIGKSFEVAAPRTLTFGYNASPFKPLVKGWRMAIHSEDGTFGGPHKERMDPKTGKKVDGWMWLSPPVLDPAEWGAVWAEFKKIADAKVRQQQPFDPTEARFWNYVHTSLPLMGWGLNSSDGATGAYFGAEWEGNPHHASQRDYYTWLAHRAFGEGGLRTIYWDIFYVNHFSSVLCDLGYELPGGQVQPMYNTLNLRLLMRRLRALQADHGLVPGGLVSHSTNAYPLAAFPWVDAALDGEWYEITDATPTDWVDMAPPERLRSMSVPHNFGTVVSWMHLIHVKDEARKNRIFRGFLDYIRLHDCSWYWQDHLRPPEAVLEWGLNDERLQYVPYWRNTALTCDDKDVLVAYWALPDRVLVMAFNYDGKQAKDPVLKVDPGKLGLAAKTPWPGALAVRELRGGAPRDPAPVLDADKGTVAVAGLQPHTARYFGIRLQEQAGVEKFQKEFAEYAGRAKSAPAGAAQVLEGLLDYGMVALQTQYLGLGQAKSVGCADGDIEIAMWQLPDRVLLALVNRNEKAVKDATVKLDLDALKLTPQLPWQESVRVRDFTPGAPPSTLKFYERELVAPKLGPQEGRLVAIRRY